MHGPLGDSDGYSPLAPTLDGTPGDTSSQKLPALRMALVEGTGPHLSEETHALLKVRLRAAALCIFFGAGLFLMWRLIYPQDDIGKLSPLVLWSHVTLVLLEGWLGLTLCVRCPTRLKRLKLYELLIFATPAAFFLLLDRERVIFNTARQDSLGLVSTIRGGVVFWYMLMSMYAMLIPNTWRRAAVVVGAMALAPVGVALAARIESPLAARLIEPAALIEMSLVMLIGWTVSVYGVHTINHLRRQAFEARQLGQYRLKSLLGSGGMGEVYLAEHRLLKRPCAIKLIRASQAADPKALARFEREVRETARLSHWNSIEIFDYGNTDDGTFYYVMEYLPGMDLGSMVDRHGPLSPQRVIHFLSQTCDALREAHGMGILHRDIKPGNIFAAQRGGVYDVAKLLDFGLVKSQFDMHSVQLTQEGAITGSPLFMSPEQAVGETDPDPRSDIYSLGAVAYFLLTGQPPFQRDRPLKVMFAHAHDEVVPPSQLRDEVPADLETVVLRCLAKKPEDRYQDAASLRDALSDCDAADRWTHLDATSWWRSVDSTRTPEVSLA